MTIVAMYNETVEEDSILNDLCIGSILNNFSPVAALIA